MAVARPVLRRLHLAWLKKHTVIGLSLSVLAGGSFYFYRSLHLPRKMWSGESQTWDEVVEVINRKSAWEDEWDSAVKQVFATSVDHNKGKHLKERHWDDRKQSYYDMFDVPNEHKYRGP